MQRLCATPDVRVQRKERMIFTYSYKMFLGSFEVNVYQQYHRLDRGLEDLVEIEILFSPNVRYCARAARLWLIYDRTHGLSSPTNIRSSFPCVRPISDPIVQMVADGRLEYVIKAFTTGSHTPNDMYVRHQICPMPAYERQIPGRIIPGCDHNFQQSLLNVSR